MAFRAVMSSKLPIVFIIGATGTGKTKLSLELAQKFATEIISADSMQIYKGLDVVTAKATKEERVVAPHHLIDILEPHQMFTVVDFRNRALKIRNRLKRLRQIVSDKFPELLSQIDNLTEQGKIPIIVGGTIYYFESIVYQILVEAMGDPDALLWDSSRRKRDLEDKETYNAMYEKKAFRMDRATDKDEEVTAEASTSKTEDTKVKEEIKVEVTKEHIEEVYNNETNYTNEDIHDKLKSIDPVAASWLHPNNRRKVLRSIEVWLKTGRKHSDMIKEQKAVEGKLRKPDSTIILWLTCEQSVLDQRLDKRITDMLEGGLIQELLDFHAKHNSARVKDGKPPDYTKGIFQTLGFKEFHEYLILKEEERNTEEGKKLLEIGIQNMRLRTKRFSRRQKKMILGRFLTHPEREVPLLYELDTTYPENWDIEVRNKAIKIIESFISGTECEFKPMKPTEIKEVNHNSSNYCEICKRLIIGDKTYAEHLKSNRHKKVLDQQKRKKEKEEQNKLK